MHHGLYNVKTNINQHIMSKIPGKAKFQDIFQVIKIPWVFQVFQASGNRENQCEGLGLARTVTGSVWPRSSNEGSISSRM